MSKRGKVIATWLETVLEHREYCDPVKAEGTGSICGRCKTAEVKCASEVRNSCKAVQNGVREFSVRL
jgi:hypothetical protein